VLDAAGHRAHRLNACGYSLGTTFAPNWMDWPMFYHGNPVEAAPGFPPPSGPACRRSGR